MCAVQMREITPKMYDEFSVLCAHTIYMIYIYAFLRVFVA